MSPKSGNRLPPGPRERVDRSRTIEFRFEGQRYQGFQGDTIASALAANDVWLLSRSFKYRRPRGILTMTGHDANTLVQLPDEPNAPADTTPIVDGLEIRGQNYSGSLVRDRGAWIEKFSKFLPVGFYYKAFFRPRGVWRYWEPVFRARAGLGRVNLDALPVRYDKAHHFYDIAVIGAGPAGLAAAAEAAAVGVSVLLVDEQPELGGSSTFSRHAPGQPEEVSSLISGALEHPGIDIMVGATCQGVFSDNWLAITQGRRLHKVRTGRIVMATGTHEQPIVFRNNDLPGVMLGTAAQRLIHQYGVRPGHRAAVATANSDGYAVALDLMDAGIEVVSVADLRHTPPVSCPFAAAVRDSGVQVLSGHTVFEAIPDSGKQHLKAVDVRAITGPGKCSDREVRLDCDLLCMNAGEIPAAQLACHRGARLSYDTTVETFSIIDCPDEIISVGSVNGTHDLEAVISEGRDAGRAAADPSLGHSGEAPSRSGDTTGRNYPWPIFPHPRGKEFVDFDEDLQVHDLLDAIGEGFGDTELLKRYSTVGMGPSQGRYSALATARIAANARGRDDAVMGTTTVRPPVSGEKMGLLAGRHFDPVRLTPMHQRHVEAGAQMMTAGQWLRPAFYGDVDEREDCIRTEALNVRNNVGMIDVSTLGGIEIRGPDAAEFMNRVYTFNYLRQPVGKSRYVLMCDQSGAIIDDGVACRLAENHYYVTATTGAADRVFRDMLWHNAQWRLNADIANSTAAWCGISLAGPHSRDVLEPLTDIDVSADAFPYLGVRCGKVGGIPARVLRVGFVGELGYEIHAPTSMGEALWDALTTAGQETGLQPFGVEAQRLLRLEKGHVIIGQDTDGLTTPEEAGMGWAVSKRKPFFVGSRAIQIRSGQELPRRAGRLQAKRAGCRAPPRMLSGNRKKR